LIQERRIAKRITETVKMCSLLWPMAGALCMAITAIIQLDSGKQAVDARSQVIHWFRNGYIPLGTDCAWSAAGYIYSISISLRSDELPAIDLHTAYCRVPITSSRSASHNNPAQSMSEATIVSLPPPGHFSCKRHSLHKVEPSTTEVRGRGAESGEGIIALCSALAI
jgi:hypothetical protein